MKTRLTAKTSSAARLSGETPAPADPLAGLPRVEVGSVGACGCGRDWILVVGPHRGTLSLFRQACRGCALRLLDLARSRVLAPRRDPGPFTLWTDNRQRKGGR